MNSRKSKRNIHSKRLIKKSLPNDGISAPPPTGTEPNKNSTPSDIENHVPDPNGCNETPLQSQSGNPEKSKIITKRELVDAVVSCCGDDNSDAKSKAHKVIRRYLIQQIEGNSVNSNYNIILLFDETTMVQSDADNIYSAVTKFSEKKPILLILHSSGGFVGPAYLIGKMLSEHSGGALEIAVPRRAKSAATLICCAANHIHMGSLSELGPIDPQIDGLPALGLKSSIQHLAELSIEHPQAVELFAKYMSQTIQPIHLGYYERVAESAMQYAERLMEPHKDKLVNSTPNKIAKVLVYSYKDHGFVIDKQEACQIFGEKIVQHNSPEYQLANSLYQGLSTISQFANMLDHNFYMIGDLMSEPHFLKKRKN